MKELLAELSLALKQYRSHVPTGEPLQDKMQADWLLMCALQNIDARLGRLEEKK